MRWINYIDFRRFALYILISFFCWSIGILVSIFLPYEELYVFDCQERIADINNNLKSIRFSENLTITIIVQNLKCIATNIFGFFSLGLTTSVNLFYNGFIHGYNIRYSLSVDGLNTWHKILPHSFELIGLYISGAVGYYGANFLLKIVFDKNIQLRKWIITSILFTIISSIIIISAAYIESHISIYQ